jgi:serine/threonine protein kinase
MSDDNKRNEEFKTRRDDVANVDHKTKRDVPLPASPNANPLATRMDGGKQENDSRTRLDVDKPLMHQRINLPPELAGAYSIVSLLPTQGGEADLLLVRENSTDKQFVLKLYRTGIVPKVEVAENVQKVSKEHPEYFIQLVDYSYSQNSAYEILEFLPLGSLSSYLEAYPTLNVQQIYEVLEQLSSALDILHKTDIVHRDLKPSNILLRQLCPLKLSLIDFGISSILDTASKRFTSTNRTLHYAPPEAMSGKVSSSSDFWSLGILLVEILTGTHPFQGLSDFTINAYLIEKPVDVSRIADSRWRSLCKGLLLRDSEKRWGKSEVNQWLKGENPLVEDDRHTATDKNKCYYRFQDKNYYDPAALAIGLAQHWDEGVKSVCSGFISKWLNKQLGEYELCGSILDIENVYEDGDLILLLAIAKLNPDIEPTYRQYSLTEKGLLALIGSKNYKVLKWLYDEKVFKIYGESTKRENYTLIGTSWEDSIERFHTLAAQVQDCDDISNNLVLPSRNDFSLHAALLKCAVAEKYREELKQTLSQRRFIEEQECLWFYELHNGDIENAASENLYLMLLLHPIAEKLAKVVENDCKLRAERLRDSCIKMSTRAEEIIKQIEVSDAETSQKILSHFIIDPVPRFENNTGSYLTALLPEIETYHKKLIKVLSKSQKKTLAQLEIESKKVENQIYQSIGIKEEKLSTESSYIINLERRLKMDWGYRFPGNSRKEKRRKSKKRKAFSIFFCSDTSFPSYLALFGWLVILFFKDNARVDNDLIVLNAFFTSLVSIFAIIVHFPMLAAYFSDLEKISDIDKALRKKKSLENEINIARNLNKGNVLRLEKLNHLKKLTQSLICASDTIDSAIYSSNSIPSGSTVARHKISHQAKISEDVRENLSEDGFFDVVEAVFDF